MEIEMEEESFSIRRVGKRMFSLYGTFPCQSDAPYAYVDRFIHRCIKLNQENSAKPIICFFASPGGHYDTFLAIFDTVKLLSCPFYTVALRACSAAAYLFIAGESEHRYLFPHAEILLHAAQLIDPPQEDRFRIFKRYQPNPIFLEILKKNNEQLAQLAIDSSNRHFLELAGVRSNSETAEQARKKVTAFLEHDFYLTAEKAIYYGFADKIITKEDIKELYADA